MANVTRRQFIHCATAAGVGSLLTAFAPSIAVAAQSTSGAEPVGSESSPRPQAWPLGTVERNRTLIYKSASAITATFSPINSNFNHQDGSSVLWEPCAYYSPLSDRTVMWLAESYAYNANATELTINFRSGIKWSDGTAFSAEDAAWSINMLLTVNDVSQREGIVGTVASVQATSALTLKITFNGANWRFFFNVLTLRMDLGNSAVILPKHIYETIPQNELATFNNYDLAQGWPVTTGPYGVGDMSGGNYINFDQRASWWAHDSGLVALMPDVWRFRAELNAGSSATANQLVNDEIDASSDIGLPYITAALALNANLTTYSGNQSPYGNVDWWPISVYFNCLRAPYNDKRVRWAVAYALDQAAILAAGYGDAGEVTATPFPDYPMLASYISGISDLLSTYNVLEQNLTKVNTLMTSAGFHKDSGGFWADGGDARLNADLFAATPLFDAIAPTIAQQLNAAGFACTVQSPDSIWNDMGDGTASLFLYGHGGATKDPLDTLNLYRSSNVQPIGQGSWGNMARWSNSTFEAAANAMAALPMDDPGVGTQFHNAMAVWLDELPDCPIIQWYHHILFNTRYWVNWPTSENPYMPPALWLNGAHQVVTNLQMKRPYKVFAPVLRR